MILKIIMIVRIIMIIHVIIIIIIMIIIMIIIIITIIKIKLNTIITHDAISYYFLLFSLNIQTINSLDSLFTNPSFSTIINSLITIDSIINFYSILNYIFLFINYRYLNFIFPANLVLHQYLYLLTLR